MTTNNQPIPLGWTLVAIPHSGETVMQTYRTFIRSCKDWKSFASARKITQATRLSYSEAQEMCREYNNNRNSRQIRRGTKMEFEQE